MGVRDVCCDTVLRLPSPPLVPGPSAVTEHLELDPVPASVGVARRFVRDLLEGVDEDSLDTVLLLVSELVTNAILHAHTPVELGVCVDGGRALVCVADRMPGSEPLTARVHSGDRPGGRGLALVADLSHDWGTTTFTGGKTVWFTLPLSMSADRMAAS
ncbi:MAG TPA: ATP-binding protein [Actinomycetes bacterium]|nr:ATP-binding protein [Actinomycetes bacterium]